jgi:2'-hydroxyisoflavone reductase
VTSAALPAGVEQLQGDRDRDLSALAGRDWDAVVDCDRYEPQAEHTHAAAALLAEHVERYVYISSVRAYASLEEPPHEESPLLDEPRSDYYGARKAACERAVAEVFGARATLIRPGVIIGPGDPLDRYTWWCCRLALGGTAVAPAPPERPMQLIDVRDLAAWLVLVVERGDTGAYNAAGARSTLGAILEATNAALGGATQLAWLDEAFLQEQGIGEWYELPLWMADPTFRSLPDVRIDRALAAGLTFRAPEETARDTLAWARAERGDRPWKAGLAPEREAALLAQR